MIPFSMIHATADPWRLIRLCSNRYSVPPSGTLGFLVFETALSVVPGVAQTE